MGCGGRRSRDPARSEGNGDVLGTPDALGALPDSARCLAAVGAAGSARGRVEFVVRLLRIIQSYIFL